MKFPFEMTPFFLGHVSKSGVDIYSTTLKTNMDTQNDGLEKVAPFKYGHFWYLC